MESSFICEIIDEIIENTLLSGQNGAIIEVDSIENVVALSSQDDSESSQADQLDDKIYDDETDSEDYDVPSSFEDDGELTDRSQAIGNDSEETKREIGHSEGLQREETINEDENMSAIGETMIPGDDEHCDSCSDAKQPNTLAMKNDDSTAVLPMKSDDKSVTALIDAKTESISGSDFYSSEYLSRKGFDIRFTENTRFVVNLPLMTNASKLQECDIQCDGMPHRMLENEIIPMFEKYGEIYKLLMRYRGTVRITYLTDEDADRAIKALDRTNIEGKIIRVHRYFDNAQLFVKPIPEYATKREIFYEFSSITIGLKKVTLLNSPHDERKIRNFCYLDYGNRKEAQNAKKQLSKATVFGRTLNVNWADSRSKWSITRDRLNIINLHSGLRSADLQTIFSVYGEIREIDKSNNFASVWFRNSEDAKRAANDVDKRKLGNENVEISFVNISPIKRLKKPHVDVSHTLFIHNLRSEVNASDLRKYFTVYGEVSDIEKIGSSASVQFRNAEDSKRAARSVDKKQFGDHNVEITFDKSTPTLKKTLDEGSNTLYINNLNSKIHLADLRKYFSVYGDISKIVKEDRAASVQFRSSEDSKRAARQIDQRTLGNVKISFSK